MKDNGRTFAHTFTAPDAVVNGVAHSDTAMHEPLTIAAHAESGVGWAQQLQTAYEYGQQRKNDKALSLWSKAMAQRGAALSETWGFSDIPKNEKLFSTVYTELFRRSKQDAIEVTPEYRDTVFFEVVPVLTAINGISHTTSELGYNRVDEVVETAVTILRAEHAKDNGGKLVIMSQLCAQYDSGTIHDQESFNRDLVQELDPEKVRISLAPMKQIIDALEKHDITVHVVTPQVSENPKLMLAMVPATVWSYVDSGRAAEMLYTLDQHTRELPPLVHDALAVTDTSARSHEAPSYAEVLTNGHNIVERTMEIATLVGQAYSLTDNLVFVDKKTTEQSWMSLSIADLRQFKIQLDHYDGVYENIIQRGREVYGWSDEDVLLYQQLLTPLFQQGWGAVDDTAKFYSREVARRAQAKGNEWKRNIDYTKEVPALLNDEKFYPQFPNEYRQAKAEELLLWVENIANLEIGGRAVFNVSLYAAMGEALGRYEEGEDVAIMWPLEEDRDRWAVEAMTEGYRSKIPSAKALPAVYPAKNLRQPFGV